MPGWARYMLACVVVVVVVVVAVVAVVAGDELDLDFALTGPSSSELRN